MESSNSSLKHKIIEFLKEKFDLSEDKAQEDEVVSNIRKSIEFKGTNLWVLIFATFIASIGLNVNSIPVIIGAMLISPLMGPIMGCGLAIGINDFELLKRSSRNYAFAVAIGLIVSWLYFSLTPLSIAQSEILSRTQPTTWDVLVAFFGGLAGIVAQSRKDRTSTVIPGVAIATALMPPLCTAGYGLATFQFNYFFGALYLLFINTVFISLATYIIVRFMKYDKKIFHDPNRERKVRRIIAATAICTVVPSILLGINIVNKTFFDTNAQRFVEKTFVFDETLLVDSKYIYRSSDDKSVEVMLVGKVLEKEIIASIENQMPMYKLNDVKLVVKQQDLQSSSSETFKGIDRLSNLSTHILQEKNNQIEDLEQRVSHYESYSLPVGDMTKEFCAFLGLDSVQLAISKSPLYDVSGNVQDTVATCYLKVIKGQVTADELMRRDLENVKQWLRVRTNTRHIYIFVE